MKKENDRQRVSLKTKWQWEHIRSGQAIDTWTDSNVVVDEGLDYLLNAALKGGTQISSWYIVTFENDFTPDGDETYAVPGYTECTAIDEATRPAWTGGSVSGQSVDNSGSRATFTYNATKTIYGGALVGGGTDATTKGDTAGGGKMYCCSRFTSGSKSVVDDDILKVTITLQAQDV